MLALFQTTFWAFIRQLEMNKLKLSTTDSAISGKIVSHPGLSSKTKTNPFQNY